MQIVLRFIWILLLYPYVCLAICNDQLQLERSQQLDKLAQADDLDRKDWDKKVMEIIIKNDLIRRKQVARIFAEGCFKEAKDYMNAALIYQHGDVPDHYYLAFIWSRKAAELGDLHGQAFSALAIDRYLNSIGHKQLFGSQYSKTINDACFCMSSVEPSFPDSFRKAYSGRSLQESYDSMATLNPPNCPRIECDYPLLQPTPKGSIIGLW